MIISPPIYMHIYVCAQMTCFPLCGKKSSKCQEGHFVQQIHDELLRCIETGRGFGGRGRILWIVLTKQSWVFMNFYFSLFLNNSSYNIFYYILPPSTPSSSFLSSERILHGVKQKVKRKEWLSEKVRDIWKHRCGIHWLMGSETEPSVEMHP